ncbi:MAG TPA: transglutaminase domain-containing protein [Chthonomonadaceae bacterium]|nr:transglutaminase domain-containing protein [Chthonomonadaceae bacterium]
MNIHPAASKRHRIRRCVCLLLTLSAILFGIRLLPAHSALTSQGQTNEATEMDDQSYTITTTVRLAPPYDLKAMNDEFQSARLIKEEKGVGEFEITYKPFHRQTVTANPNWKRDDAAMSAYLRPRTAANWDEDLRKRILQDLHEAGIDPDTLDDKTLVEKVSEWAMHRSTFNSQFGLWMVEFVNGKPVVAPQFKQAFAHEEPAGVDDDVLFNRELFGKGMYENKTHGACTSTSTYLATILRAIGIPTRILLTVPACDPNDPKQVAMLLAAVRHHRIRREIQYGVNASGFVNHVFNEVWVGGKWVRLNYNRLGQPIVDRNYEGLMTHVFTANDISEIPFSTTWGARYALETGPKLSSVNPYQMLSATDFVKPGAKFDNPPIPSLPSATIVAILKPGDPRLPEFVKPGKGTDAILQIKEWIAEDNYLQLRDFIKGANATFLLRAPGKPELKATLTGGNYSSGDGVFQGFGIRIEGKPEAGAAYHLVPQNDAYKNKWVVSEDVLFSP